MPIYIYLKIQEALQFEKDEKEGIQQNKINNYNNSKLLNVLLYNTIFMISLPFIAIHEIGVATWNAIYRALGWSDVSNKVVPESKEAISFKIAALV